jgi:hypothetical protein
MATETVTEKSDEVCYVLFLSNKTTKLAHMKRLSKRETYLSIFYQQPRDWGRAIHNGFNRTSQAQVQNGEPSQWTEIRMFLL